MSNFQGVKTSEQFCKVKYNIEVESEKYDADEAYSKSIDKTLNTLFTRDINPTI